MDHGSCCVAHSGIALGHSGIALAGMQGLGQGGGHSLSGIVLGFEVFAPLVIAALQAQASQHGRGVITATVCNAHERGMHSTTSGMGHIKIRTTMAP